MENFKKVPWVDWNEWSDCWALLRSSPLEALKMLEIWSHIDTLPVRIECTRQLLNSLQELTQTGNPMELLKLKSETSRLAMSMAIVRSTNLIIDTYNDGKFAKSVSNTAKSINLPEFVVDLRHEATHSNLPSSFLLAKATQSLLSWLFNNYWAKQAETLSQKTEKILNDIDKFEKRAKTASDNYLLAKFSENLFTEKILFKGKTGKNMAQLRWTMKDEAWAMMFLSVRSKNPFFAASVVQGVLHLLREQRVSLDQAKMNIEEIIALASPIKISYTPSVKHLIRLQNEEKGAFELVGVLLEHQFFEEEIQETVKKTHNATVFSDIQADICEIQQLPMKRWRKLETWSQRPIGAYSLFQNPA